MNDRKIEEAKDEIERKYSRNFLVTDKGRNTLKTKNINYVRSTTWCLSRSETKK